MKKVLLTCAAAGLLVGSTVASAAAIAPAPMFHPWYVGVGLKWNALVNAKIDYPTGQGNGQVKLKNKLGWDIFGGYLVTPKFGTELGFVDYGKMTRTQLTNAGVNSFKINSNGWLVYLDGMYYVPVCPHLKVFAKGGVDYINHQDKHYTWDGAAWVQPGANYTDPNVKRGIVSGNLGAGVQIDYRQFSLRGTYTNYELFLNDRYTNATALDGRDTAYIPNLLNVDFLYHFG
ncbi:MAG: outer membrane beta-barrel protein [Gammaproteobacteria bacterium]|jgi:hypothetical protein